MSVCSCSRPHLPQRGTAYIPLLGYAPGLVRLSGGLFARPILKQLCYRTLVPPPASCGEERHMCASRLDCHTTSGSFQRALSFSLRCCATLRSSGSDPASGETCKIRTCDLYPFRLSDGFRPVPDSACPRLSGVSAPWPLERIV